MINVLYSRDVLNSRHFVEMFDVYSSEIKFVTADELVTIKCFIHVPDHANQLIGAVVSIFAKIIFERNSTEK